MDNWVYKYLNYPQEAIAQGVDGYQRIEDSKGKVTYKAVVYVSFIIEADGNISNVAIERGFSEPLDDEALRVVSASPKWKPATIDGKKVRTKIVIPVEYHLKNR
ncbi:MAG: energy transducer TonB [Bacteroidales bacterium]|nr:energy transducer TonB [Bacteroidales bacterium]